jgi:hypothetical protein
MRAFINNFLGRGKCTCETLPSKIKLHPLVSIFGEKPELSGVTKVENGIAAVTSKSFCYTEQEFIYKCETCKGHWPLIVQHVISNAENNYVILLKSRHENKSS